MPERLWFFAARGQQQGPVPEPQFRELIGAGTVTADTLVWTEGMTGWQKAGDIPGLLAGSGPPAMAPSEGALISAGGGFGEPLSIEFGIWEFFWRSLVLAFGLVFIIPGPWVILMYFRWIASCVRVPQRPNLAFTGQLVDALWFYAFAIIFVGTVWTQSQALSLLADAVQLVLYWVLIKWFVANLSSNGQPLGLRFSGSAWGYIGWSLLVLLAAITIIGWAWVYVAQTRWMCRHVEGTRRAVVFKGTGLEFLWRSLATLLGSILIVTAPWLYRWFIQWLVSQTVLVERDSPANV
jgi:hypothetical protein